MRYAAMSDQRLVPFVFACTGHRWLRDEDKVQLRSRVVAIFDECHKTMPHTPLVLLSGLAEGADQLTAECALNCGVSVIAVLPMPLTIYRTTMSPTAAENLDWLIKQSKLMKVLPGRAVPDGDLVISEEKRAACYDDLAKYLAFNSQIMLALWDGAPSDKKGGTARVVDYMLRGSDEAEGNPALMDSPPGGIVYHLLAPRPGHQDIGVAGTLEVLVVQVSTTGRARRVLVNQEQIAETAFGRVQDGIERFNRLSHSCRLSLHRHHRLPNHSGLPNSEFLGRIDAICMQADGISQRAAKQRRTFFFGILVAVSIGTLWYSIADEVYKEDLGLWLVLPTMITFALLLSWLARRTRVDDLYVDARALSETLRVQYFWQMACIKERAVDHYLPHHAWEVDWVRYALSNLMLLRRDEAAQTCTSASVDGILKVWIEDQRKWYLSKSNQQRKHVERGNAISRWTLFAGLAWSTVIPVTLLMVRHVRSIHGAVEGWLHVPGVVLTIIAGTYRLWIDQSGFNEQSREYGRIGHYLAHQAVLLSSNRRDVLKVQEMLMAIGIETLQENARWVLLHRERPLEVTGG